MRIGVPKETAPGERRVALVPESCKKLKQAGYEIAVEAGAGVPAGYPDDAYREVGVALESDPAALLGGADVALKVGPPSTDAGRDEVALASLGRHLPRLAHAAPPPRGRASARRARRHRLRHRRHPPDHPRPEHGHALLHGEHRRVQGRPAGRGRAQQVLPDVHDGRGHGAAGQGLRHRRGRRRAPGHRHRQAPRRPRHRHRRPARGEGADRERRRQVRRDRAHRERRRGRRLRQGAVRRGQGAAARDPRRPGGPVGRRGHDGAHRRRVRAEARHRRHGAVDEARRRSSWTSAPTAVATASCPGRARPS